MVFLPERKLLDPAVGLTTAIEDIDLGLHRVYGYLDLEALTGGHYFRALLLCCSWLAVWYRILCPASWKCTLSMVGTAMEPGCSLCKPGIIFVFGLAGGIPVYGT